MRTFFINRNYPANIVAQALAKATSVTRESALTSRNHNSVSRIPFPLTFHPANLGIKSIITRNFQLLTTDQETSAIFDQPPLFSFKRDRSLRDYLVKGTLLSEKESGTFKCSRSRCFTCPHISTHTTVTGPKSTFKIADHFECTSSNVVYCIKCTLCNHLYIGETGRRLGDRIRDHIYHIRKSDLMHPNLFHVILILPTTA
jgi:hypothetical protein